MRRIVLAILMLLSGPVYAASDDGVLSVTGVVENSALDPATATVAFEIVSVPQHFVLDVAGAPDRAAIDAALNESRDQERAVIVHFYGDTGGFDQETGKPTYVVAGIEYDGKTMAGEGRETSARIADVSTPAELQLARGIALRYAGGSYDDTHAMLDLALADASLSSFPRSVGLMVRGEMASQRAVADTTPGPARDQLLVAALADFSGWGTLRPNNQTAALAVARTQAQLGAYDEALNGLRGALEKWPNDTTWTYIVIGMIERTRGDNAKALAALDELVAHNGPQDGMVYHYHRGWTFTALGRNEDAIAELTAGLATQPEFPGAYIQRACALARMGRLSDALADEEKAVETLRAWGAEAPVQEITFNVQQAAIAIARLRRAMDRDEHEKSDAPCNSVWDEGFTHLRERSPLLPQRSAATGAALQTPAPMQ